MNLFTLLIEYIGRGFAKIGNNALKAKKQFITTYFAKKSYLKPLKQHSIYRQIQNLAVKAQLILHMF